MITGTGPDGRPRWGGGGAAEQAAGLCGEQGAGCGKGEEQQSNWRGSSKQMGARYTKEQ